MQLPRGWADTGALHTAGGDTSPPHNSWQPGQRRSPSCRRRRRLCRCSSCYCGAGGSPAAAGSVRGAGSAGLGEEREPVRGHLHLQPQRRSPCPRLYSGSGTRPPAARRGHDSAGPARAAAPTAAPSAALARAAQLRFADTPGAPRPSYHRRCRLGAGREAGAGGGVGRGGGGGSARPPGAGTRSAAKFLQLRPAGGSAGRGTWAGPAAIGAELAALSASRPWDGGGRGMVCGAPRPRSSRFPPVSVTWLPARASPPQGAFTGNHGERPGLRAAERAEEKQSRLQVNWISPPFTITAVKVNFITRARRRGTKQCSISNPRFKLAPWWSDGSLFWLGQPGLHRAIQSNSPCSPSSYSLEVCLCASDL